MKGGVTMVRGMQSGWRVQEFAVVLIVALLGGVARGQTVEARKVAAYGPAAEPKRLTWETHIAAGPDTVIAV